MRRWTAAEVAEIEQKLKENTDFVPSNIPTGHRRHKYGAKRCEIDGLFFASKLEGRLYQHLKFRQSIGDIKWFVRQVPFDCGGGVVYRADFLAVLAQSVEVWDAKGMDLPSAKNKRKQALERYGVSVLLWNDGKRLTFDASGQKGLR